MHDILNQVFTYLKGIWRFRWYIYVLAWPLCLAGWIMVYTLPDQYQASARIYVDTESMLKPLLQGLAVNTTLSRQVVVMKKTLLSRPNLERVVRMADMDISAKSEQDLDELYGGLKKRILVQGRGDNNLYSITYTNSDPMLAKKVVQSLLTIFVESSLGGTRSDTTLAQKFLDDQIREYENRLYEAEDRLKDFKRKNIGLMPSDGRGYYSRLEDMKSQLIKAKLELREEKNRRDELLRQQEGEEPTFGIMSSNLPKAGEVNTSIDTRIQKLQTKLDELLLNFTSQHPDVVSLKGTIEKLQIQKEKEKVAEMQKLGTMGGGNQADLKINPVYQQLKISLSIAEANVAALDVRVKEYEERVKELQKLVNTVPKVEAELAQLNRDYDVNKKNYETLLARRESAKISEEAERSSDNIKFKVIDPPRVPLAPVSPNRPLLISGVLFGSLAIGVIFALFMSQIKPVFFNPRMIMEATHRPVFGTVSNVMTKTEISKTKMDLMLFVLTGICLAGFYGSYIVFQLLSQ